MNGAPREETEEEYDARLEREEKERIEAAKRRHLEELKRRYQEDEAKRRSNAPEDGQVRFKGLYWINIFCLLPFIMYSSYRAWTYEVCGP